MDLFKPHRRAGKAPEEAVHDAIEKMLREKGWFVKRTHGSAFTSGWPDIWASHSRYGHRWIEVKLPNMKGSKFTAAQLEDFPKFCANGSHVFVLTAATETEYNKLFQPCNYHMYLSIMK